MTVCLCNKAPSGVGGSNVSCDIASSSHVTCLCVALRLYLISQLTVDGSLDLKLTNFCL